MPLELTRYDVALAHDGLDLDKALDAGDPDGYHVHRVTVLHADQLVAEQAAPRYGIPPLGEGSTQKMTWATLWVWCGLRRMQVPVAEFPAFKGRLLSVDPVDPTDDPFSGTECPHCGAPIERVFETQPDADPDADAGALALDPTAPPHDIDSR